MLVKIFLLCQIVVIIKVIIQSSNYNSFKCHPNFSYFAHFCDPFPVVWIKAYSLSRGSVIRFFSLTLRLQNEGHIKKSCIQQRVCLLEETKAGRLEGKKKGGWEGNTALEVVFTQRSTFKNNELKEMLTFWKRRKKNT